MDQAAAKPVDPEASAKAAGLVYVSDEIPGITRRRAGRGFAYYAPDGKRITDAGERKRLNALAIPPAYTDVWISPDPRGHIQATGRDERGRKQYRYHADWDAFRGDRKFGMLLSFARALPLIRERVDQDLRRRNPGFEKAVATVVFLLDRLLIRVGNAAYARDNESYGLTTLKGKHLVIEGSRMRFRFRGKSGKEWSLHHSDRRIARAIRSLQELPGQHLFQYVDDDGTIHPVTSSDVNAYIREATGDDFTSRQFRTWAATALSAAALCVLAPGTSRNATTRTVNEVIDAVAKRLGNTRAVCRQSYIHPQVLESFEKGLLAEQMAGAPPLKDVDVALLGEDERRVLHWLAQQH